MRISDWSSDVCSSDLKPGGLFHGTLLSKRNRNYGLGREIAPDTFVIDGAAGDKGHPHFYCDAAGVVKLVEDFELLSLFDREHESPGTYHWQLLAERRSHSEDRKSVV